jgi:subtilase-type serine protease
LPSSPLVGPGSTNFVPMNTDGTPGTAFANPAMYFEVWLNRAGTVTLNSLKDIDRLELNHSAARLWIQDTGGDLLTVIETAVLAGNLTVDGNLFSPSVINMFGSTVNGHGDIYTTLFQNQARVAPGNSIGTLTIIGNYTQGAAGLLEIELTNGSGDVLAVTGNASLAGAVSFAPFGPNPLAGQSHVFLTTGGTRTGTFSTIIDLLPGDLFPTVTYTANSAIVTVRGLCSGVTGPIQAPVCSTLANAAVQSDADMIPAISALQSLAAGDAAAFNDALESLNPTRVHAQTMAGLTTGDLLRNQFGRRTNDLMGGVAEVSTAQLDMRGAQLASADPSADMLASAAAVALAGASGESSAIQLANGHALFFAGDAAMTDTDQPGGLGKDKADVMALTAGLDHSDGNGFVFGGALSYLSSEVEQSYGFGGETTSDGYAASGYASLNRDRFYVDAFLSYAWHDFETNRRLLVGPGTFADATGETEGTHSQFGATVGYGLSKTKIATLNAVGGLYYINLDIDGYTETGAGPLSAVIGARTIDSLKGQLGGELSLRFDSESDLLMPLFRVVWNHEFSDDGLAVNSGFAGAPATTFTSIGPDLDKDWLTIGVGMTGRISDATSFYFRYQRDISRDGQDNEEVSAAARVAF